MSSPFLSDPLSFPCLLLQPCVVTIMGAVMPKKNIEPMLVMECMDHGSLYDLLHNRSVALPGSALLPIMRDIAQGMSFLHLANPPIIHGDLKAANCLVDSKLRCKVADFGLSQKRRLGATGTPYWMAPELLRKETSNTMASDVYAMGIVLYEVYSRSEPYEGEEPMEVLISVSDKNVRKRPPIPPACPAWVQGLMTDCLCEEPEQRPTFEELDKRFKRADVESVEPDQKTLGFRRSKLPPLHRSVSSPLKRTNTRTAITLFDLFPSHIAKALSEGRAIDPEHHDCVSVYFSDIVNYTTISGSLHATKVADMLDRLYLKFDELTKKFDIYKVCSCAAKHKVVLSFGAH